MLSSSRSLPVDPRFVIRPLTAEDAAAFRELRLEAVVDSPTSFLPTAEELASKSLAEVAADLKGARGSTVFGMFEQEALVAVIGLRQEELLKRRHIASIWGVYTRPGWRRRGLSRALLAHVLDSARAADHVRAVLLFVNPENLPAKTMYLSFGFCSIGLQPMSLCIGDTYVAEEWMMLTLPEKSR